MTGMPKMKHLKTAGPALLAACLLQACGHAPPRQPLAVAPVLRIDDARAAIRQQRQATPAGMPAASAPQPTQPATLAPSPSRMEIVQLRPNEYRLQYRQASAPPQASPAAAAARTPDQVQIVNGNGVRGLGARVRRLLARHGIDAGRVVNQRGHRQRATIIEYLPGQELRAGTMLAALQGRATLLPARALPDGLTLRLVLGRDHAAGLALAVLDGPAAPDRALAVLDGAAIPHFNQE